MGLQINMDEESEMSKMEHVLGKNIYRKGIIADGSCLLHCVLYAKSFEYRRANKHDRLLIVALVREKLSWTAYHILKKCGYNLENYSQEVQVRKRIQNVREYFDECGLRLLMEVYQVNIIVVGNLTGEVLCGQKNNHSDQEVVDDDEVKEVFNEKHESMVVYLLDYHYELLFFRGMSYNKYIFGMDDPIMQTLRQRYLGCCIDMGNKLPDCHSSFLSLSDMRRSANVFQHLQAHLHTTESLRDIAFKLGVDESLITALDRDDLLYAIQGRTQELLADKAI